MDYLKRAAAMSPELREYRRQLHQIPEVGLELPQTSAFVEQTLREMGYTPKRLGKSGITATAGGKRPGKTILLRADMDALPLQEESGLPFASQNGNAHACGHDMHTAMLLGAARLLKECESALDGTVKLLFQPGEETMNGAKEMVQEGILDDPHVDAALGGHMLPMAPTGFIGYNAGVVAASSDNFTITVTGKGCHGAQPQDGVDPLQAAVHLYLAYQGLISREIDPKTMAVLTFGSLHAGDAANVIPKEAVLTGTLRTLDKDVRAFLLHRMEEVAETAAETFRASARLRIDAGTPPLAIDPTMANILGTAWKSMLGNRCAQVNETMSSSEDFAEIAQYVPTMFFVVGGGTPDQGHVYGLHHPKVTFDENCLPFGAAAYAQGAAAWLSHMASSYPGA